MACVSLTIDVERTSNPRVSPWVYRDGEWVEVASGERAVRVGRRTEQSRRQLERPSAAVLSGSATDIDLSDWGAGAAVAARRGHAVLKGRKRSNSWSLGRRPGELSPMTPAIPGMKPTIRRAVSEEERTVRRRLSPAAEEAAWAEMGIAADGDGRRELKVMSWNIWFGDVAVLSRLDAIGAVVEAEAPAVLALQEVTPPVLAHLLKQEWAQGYYVSDARGTSLYDYGVVLFSRFPMTDLEICDMCSRLQRRVVFASFLLPSGATLSIATAHLESTESDAHIRASQLAHIFGALASATYGVFLGDTNMAADAEDAAVAAWPAFLDVWPALHPHDPGHTVDHACGAMAGRHGDSARACRLDRVFVSAASVAPVDMRLLGQVPIPIVQQEGFSLEKALPDNVAIYPSDHYAVAATLALLPPHAIAPPAADAPDSATTEHTEHTDVPIASPPRPNLAASHPAFSYSLPALSLSPPADHAPAAPASPSPPPPPQTHAPSALDTPAVTESSMFG